MFSTIVYSSHEMTENIEKHQARDVLTLIFWQLRMKSDSKLQTDRVSVMKSVCDIKDGWSPYLASTNLTYSYSGVYA